MTLMRALVAELRKAATLPGVWAGAGVAALGSVALTVLNASIARAAIDAGEPQRVADTSPFETAFSAMPLGTVGAVVIGVVIVSSEYARGRAEAGGARQITTTLAAIPGRTTVLVAKAVTLVLAVAAVVAVTLPASVGVALLLIGGDGSETVTLGDAVARGLGGTLYWTLMGLLALAIAMLTRGGIIPLVVLIANSSVVSISILLTNLTPLAHWLPDLAGRRLFDGPYMMEGGLDALPGGLVMAGWALLMLGIAGVVFARRDA